MRKLYTLACVDKHAITVNSRGAGIVPAEVSSLMRTSQLCFDLAVHTMVALGKCRL